MEIVIMRHGEPDVAELSNKISSKNFPDCLEIYNSRGILETSRPDITALDRFQEVTAVVSSDLKRAVESAALFPSHQPTIIDPLFREVEGAFLNIPILKLSPRTWGTIFILLWFVGLFDLKKSIREAKLRAKCCAEKLIELAEDHGEVLFVGHGFINIYIAKELTSLGWCGPKMPGKRYWEYGVYQKE